MMINPISRLSANNAAFNWMSVANAQLNMLSFGSGDPASLCRKEKAMDQQMLMDSFNYKCYSAMADTQEKIQKDNIKRTFSIFA